jgi:hypothetical protein
VRDSFWLKKIEDLYLDDWGKKKAVGWKLIIYKKIQCSYCLRGLVVDQNVGIEILIYKTTLKNVVFR